MLKVGFIGFGSFAQLRLAIVKRFDDVKCVGFFDPYALILDSDLKRFQTREELIDAVDVIIVSVPPIFAPDAVVAALNKGRHVFCEKPPSINSSELAKIDKPSSGVVLAYGFNHRLHDSVVKIKNVIDNNALGKILWMRGRYGKEVDDEYRKNWRCDKNLNGGGILIDQGIHLLDLMNWLSGGFDYVQSILSDGYLNIEGVEDNAFINLSSSKTGIVASLHSTITQWRYLFSLEIFCEKGAIVLNGLKTRSGSYGDEVLTIRHRDRDARISDEEILYEKNNSWDREMRAFFESILAGQDYPYAGFDQAHEIMTLLDNLYDSAIWIHANKQ
jgi:1,5-anhydro-D-fructose reductase (1,5-anhydro-D-mannitol-forming)